MKKSGPRIGLWDIETSYLLMAAFSRYDLKVAYSQVFQEWFIISATFKILGEKTIHRTSLLDDMKRFKKDFKDDYVITKTLRDFISSVDILIAHNGDNFDWKKFKAKLIKHKLPPIRKPLLIDTFKEAKTAHFTSAKLGDLAIFLELDAKKHSSSGDWLTVTLPYGKYEKGEITKQKKIAAIKRILKYNVGDLPPLEALYLELRPYMTRHPNLNQWHVDAKRRCKNCGSVDIISDGFSRGYKQYTCKSCGHKFRDMTRGKIIQVT